MKLKTIFSKIAGVLKALRRKKTPKKVLGLGDSRPPKQKALATEGLAVLLWKGPRALNAVAEFSQVQLSAHSQRAYKNDLSDFFVYLKQNGFESADAFARVTPIHVAQYRGYLLNERSLQKASVTRKLAVLKSFYKWAQAQGWTDRNPAELVKAFPQSQDSKTGFLNDSDISQFLDSLEEEGTERLTQHLKKLVIETLLFLGLRRGEAARICLGHIEYNDDIYLLRVQGKGDRERLLPLPPKLLESWEQWLRRILQDEGLPNSTLLENPKAWLDFFRRHNDQPLLISSKAKAFNKSLSTSEIGHIVRKAGRVAGIAQRVSPHMLRATAITHALDQGASHRGVQQMAGWTSPLMISRYDKRRNDPRFSAIFHLKYAQWFETQTHDKKEKTEKEFPSRHDIGTHPEN